LVLSATPRSPFPKKNVIRFGLINRLNQIL
jgi:hypothetical protein